MWISVLTVGYDVISWTYISKTILRWISTEITECLAIVRFDICVCALNRNAGWTRRRKYYIYDARHWELRQAWYLHLRIRPPRPIHTIIIFCEHIFCLSRNTRTMFWDTCTPTSTTKRSRSQSSPIPNSVNKSSRMTSTPPVIMESPPGSSWNNGQESMTSMSPKIDKSALFIPVELGDDAPQWAKVLSDNVSSQIQTVHDKLSNQIANSITLSGENSLAIRRLQHQNTNLKANLDYMENRFNQIQDRLLQQEVERRQDNLIIHGIPEKTWEKKEQTEQMAREYISTALNMPTDDITFKNITRMGTRDRKKRPILITFMHSSDRQQIWKAKHDTGHTPELVNEQQVNTQDIGDARPIPPNVFITQDYPPEIQVRRRRLIPIFKRAKKLDEYRDTTYIRHDKLVIKGVTYTIHNLYTLPKELHPVAVSTIRQGDCIFFWGSNSPFSNHHPAVFVIDGVRYNCMEQYYMHKIALTAKDFTKANAIMAASDPVTQKQISKSIKRATDWDKMAPGYMMNGLRAKFTQNALLRSYLTNTGSNNIAEASPTDTYWGIGLGLDSDDKADRTKWTGENHLGRLLCDLREELKLNKWFDNYTICIYIITVYRE